MRRQITMGEVVDAALFKLRASLFSSMPGLVKAYYPGQQGVSPPTVDVQPGVQDVRLDTETGALVFEPWPVIPKVPVAFLQFGGFALWGPLKAGDDVQLVAHDLDPSTFRSTGAHSKPVFTRRGSGAFWWAHPGSIVDPNGLPDPGNAICFGTPGGVIVSVSASGINLSGDASAVAVALAAQYIDTFLTACYAAVATAAPGATAAAALAAAVKTWGTATSWDPLGIATTTGATKVKAK